MSTLCYPYGGGITCVCEEARIYKCFPDLQTNTENPREETDHQHQLPELHTNNLNGLDRSTEIVLASTFLILVILIFLAFLVHRCEKTLSRRHVQNELRESDQCPKTEFLGQCKKRILSSSVSIQTETETRGGDRSVSSLHLGHGPVTYYGILNTELGQAETTARSYDETSRSEVEEMSDTDNTGNNT